MLSRVQVIVPGGFQAQEGPTSDDVQAGQPVTDNKVLRRRVAGRDSEGSRWREAGAATCEGCVEYSPTVRGRRLIREIERFRHGSGLSMEAAAQRLGWSTSKLYRLEAARSRGTASAPAGLV